MSKEHLTMICDDIQCDNFYLCKHRLPHKYLEECDDSACSCFICVPYDSEKHANVVSKRNLEGDLKESDVINILKALSNEEDANEVMAEAYGMDDSSIHHGYRSKLLKKCIDSLRLKGVKK